jgi:hypothetical protein
MTALDLWLALVGAAVFVGALKYAATITMGYLAARAITRGEQPDPDAVSALREALTTECEFTDVIDEHDARLSRIEESIGKPWTAPDKPTVR